MFKMFHKGTGRVYTVYAVNGLFFMAWDSRESTWLWLPMTECEPVEDE